MIKESKIIEELRKETKKQLARAEKKRKSIKAKNKKGEDMLKNIDAYIADCKHFLKENMLIEAFEAAVWAWAWLEIGEQLGLLSQKTKGIMEFAGKLGKEKAKKIIERSRE